MILHCLYIDRVNPDFTALPAPYQAGFLDAAALRPYVGRPEFDMPESFVRRALDAHDECFAIREGDRLAAYGWYAIGANHFADGLTLHFSPEWVYMYRGYTHPAYRGQRLHAIGMTLALEAYRARGFKGLVSCVEAGNTASLKSVDRMGYRRFGTIYGIRLGRLVGMRHATSGWLGRQVIYSTPGCKTFGFWLERRPGFDATSSAPEPLKV